MVGGRRTYSHKVNQVLTLVNHKPIKSSIHTQSIPIILFMILIILLIFLPGVRDRLLAQLGHTWMVDGEIRKLLRMEL